MSEQPTFFGRIGNWFKRKGSDEVITPDEDPHALATRGTFLRPWARNEQAIHRLQEGFTTLTDLMGSVRDHLDKQSTRQDELLKYLSHLPEVLQSIPESNRVNAETLRGIQQHLSAQNDAQARLAEILDNIGKTGGETRQAMDEIRQGVQTLGQYDQRMSEALSGVGSAMKDVSRNSETSTEVLQTLRDNLNRHDEELERIIQRQNSRFTTLLVVAIVLAILSLATVLALGYVLLNQTR